MHGNAASREPFFNGLLGYEPDAAADGAAGGSGSTTFDVIDTCRRCAEHANAACRALSGGASNDYPVSMVYARFRADGEPTTGNRRTPRFGTFERRYL